MTSPRRFLRFAIATVGRAQVYLAPLLLAGLIALFFWKLAFSNLILARGDTFLYFYPYWQAAADALRAGHVPLWNSHLFMGAPFAANSQIGFFYPLNWPVWYLLPTPYAVSASILLHLFIAAAGAWTLARRQMRLSASAALLAALLFPLGGYVSAQVEHVNQVQGLAWLPWLLVVADGGEATGRRSRALTRSLLIAVLFALQLTAGHTQTVFISGIAVLGWMFARVWASRAKHGRLSLARVLHSGLPLLLGAPLALLLAAVQVVPTWELMQHSSRAGGLALREVVSFSLNPVLFGQALLPHYRQATFSEYTAFLPFAALFLAIAGAWRWRRSPHVRGALLLAGSGLFLALGRFNPIYLLLARLPGFNFFRAPARWLALYGLGMALLAGAGWDGIRQRESGADEGTGVRLRAPALATGLFFMVLIAWALVSPRFGDTLPLGSEAPLEAPSTLTLLAWGIELLFLGCLYFGRRLRRLLLGFTPLLLLAALFFASRALPYNQPTAPSAYFDLRPPLARLQALQRCDLLPAACQQPAGRLLGLSAIFFDPGDLAEITALYGDQLDTQALETYVVAVKQKEIIAPNLPLAFGLNSVDGFDGGLLPLNTYAQVVQLLLPEGQTAPDGRLREYLDAIPQERWLNLFNARYVITDKVGDVWRQGVFFDLQHKRSLAAGDSIPVGYVPTFTATELWVLGGGGGGSARLRTVGGVDLEVPFAASADGLWIATFPEPLVLSSIALIAGEKGWDIAGASLVDRRNETFHSLVPGQYRLILSGDVKLYENQDVLPRAFLLQDWVWKQDLGSALAQMADPSFDPARTAVLLGTGAASARTTRRGDGHATIAAYEAEEVIVTTRSESPSLLLLTDTIYPGWRATVDGSPVEILQADGLFRGVFVPPGSHEVRFVYAPRSFAVGRTISLAAVVATGVWLLLAFLRRRAYGGRATATNR